MSFYKIRILVLSSFIGLFLSFFIGCGKDNYSAPDSVISGQITYKGNPLYLKGTDEAIQLQLYQEGYDLNDHIPVYVNQEGKFNVKTFDGQYKLITRNNNGPWENQTDTLEIDLKGSFSDINYEVTPYFWIDKNDVELDNSKHLTGSIEIQKVVETASLDYVMVLVSKTQFVDNQSNVYREDIAVDEDDDITHIDISEDLSNVLEEHDNLYVRVGVQAKGADQALYTEVKKIK